LIYLDTHVLGLLYAGRLESLPASARLAIESEDLLVSPMVGLELQFLFERGRSQQPAAEVLGALAIEIGVKVCDLSFPLVAARARDLAWTRDPFDRMIVAQAIIRGAPLLTRDRQIREHYADAVWDAPPSIR
jgi:PIN domain nuclease of toxin-antitoxin system